MKYKFIIILFFNAIISCGGNSDDDIEKQNDSSVVYTPSNEVISNPERGFMHLWSVKSEGQPISEAVLNDLKSENVTIINRLYYLEAFKNSDLSAAQLNLIKTDFERFRNAGVKCILRFAYTDDIDGEDASLNIIESHLDQLKSLVSENSDVIAFVQAGFIGAWGEWYFSSNGLANTEGRRAVLTKMLEVFPKEIKIQVRAPLYKQNIFNYSEAIGTDVGYGTSDLARVGFHNDCFLASADDYGTYQNVSAEKTYISKEAFFVPTGGETCPPTDVPIASCSKSEIEMALLKWSYLNLDYYGPVLDEWRANNCFNDFQRKLGYRLLLKTGNFKNEVSQSSNYQLDLVLQNVGFAPVYNMKNTFLVFKSKEGVLYKKELNFDIRRVVPNVDYNLTESVNLSGIPVGEYELFLKIEDGSEALKDRSEYAIRLANADAWESSEGMNNLLHTIKIN